MKPNLKSTNNVSEKDDNCYKIKGVSILRKSNLKSIQKHTDFTNVDKTMVKENKGFICEYGKKIKHGSKFCINCGKRLVW